MRWVGGLAAACGLAWAVTGWPSAPSAGTWLLVGSGGFVWLVGQAFAWTRQRYARSEAAARHLARRSFRVTRSILGVDLRTLIAADDRERIAIVELGRGGDVLTARILTGADVSCDALEDGEVLDERSPARARTRGRLVLEVRVRDKTFEIGFLDRVPRDADGDPDLEGEYQQARDCLAWWRDLLQGRAPAGPYKPGVLLPRVSPAEMGAAVDAAEADLDPAPPPARVVKS